MRSTWIGILERAGAVRPIACPIGEDLSRLGLYSLRRIAHHTNRLEQNWSRSNPQLIGAVRVVRCWKPEIPWSIIAVIPGTDIVLLHDFDFGIVCYDLQTVTPITIPLHEVDRTETSVQFAHYNEYGKHLTAVAYDNE